MKQISNYDQFEATEVVSGGLKPGIYKARILKVEDKPEKEYLEIRLDVVEGPYAGYFAKSFMDNPNPDAKWSNQGIWRASYKETATKFFKAFITAIEKSNLNYRWNWDEQSLVNKLCVIVLGEEEYEADGEVKVSTKIREIRSTDALAKGEIKVPEIKKLKKAVSAPAVTEISDGDMPF